ncbi:putative calcium-binding protein CML27 [Camellia lanceoleosa]|uniref:Calcium-binding protein CML27 n=1 Tax=Camellia lanceoleosa TaxID=1840588 RepID=A0ACC0HYP5_9ERIC|nr:putative calcium-binding protein CML27 [Camellia lanceoleosa]
MVNSSSNDKHSATTLGNMEEVAKVFKKFNANGDGKISTSERSSEVQRIMLEIDSDDNGFIDLKEFADFYRRGSNNGDESSNKELCDGFDLYDQDGNGLISAKKLHAVLKSLMIKSVDVDVDGDGCVNFEEFKKMVTA